MKECIVEVINIELTYYDQKNYESFNQHIVIAQIGTMKVNDDWRHIEQVWENFRQ